MARKTLNLDLAKKILPSLLVVFALNLALDVISTKGLMPFPDSVGFIVFITAFWAIPFLGIVLLGALIKLPILGGLLPTLGATLPLLGYLVASRFNPTIGFVIAIPITGAIGGGLFLKSDRIHYLVLLALGIIAGILSYLPFKDWTFGK